MLDICCSAIALIGLSPVLLVLAMLIRIKIGTPVIFRQKRAGKNEDIFTLYKFRTMTNEKDENGNLLPAHMRITKFGQLLRKTSLDELPELFNILRGDMSIVGPRPLVVEYLPYYTDHERKRHDIKPGLTGYAQINGRNYLSWEERFKLDVFYVEHYGFLFDVKIVWETIKQVFKRQDVVDHSEVKTDENGSYIYNNGKKHRSLNLERRDWL